MSRIQELYHNDENIMNELNEAEEEVIDLIDKVKLLGQVVKKSEEESRKCLLLNYDCP